MKERGIIYLKRYDWSRNTYTKIKDSIFFL